VRPWFGEKPINRISPADIRRWQAHLAASTGHATLMQCRSPVLRVLQFAVDEGALDSNPVRKVPSPRQRADPEQVLDQTKRRALTPEDAGRLLAQFPLFWWDHVLCLLGTGLRFGELAGLRRRRVHLDRRLPVL
jgi:integrase